MNAGTDAELGACGGSAFPRMRNTAIEGLRTAREYCRGCAVLFLIARGVSDEAISWRVRKAGANFPRDCLGPGAAGASQ